MRKITHPKFEIGLSNLKLSDTEQTHWFSDSIFSKYSLPAELKLNDETAVLFEFVDEHQINNAESYFEVMYWHNDFKSRAIFEIEEIDGDRLTFTLRYGFDEFPNFQKKIAELPFDPVVVADIYQHAAVVITQGYPTVKYNFPQIHVDKVEDPLESDVWFAFENILNNYKSGAFLENEVIEDIAYNRNIIQPLPYVLYVLEVGFKEAGFKLRGSAVNHPLLQRMLLYSEKEYYKVIVPESVDLGIIYTDDELVTYERQFSVNFEYVTFEGIPYGTTVYHIYRKYVKTISITNKGKYRVIGDVLLGRSKGNTVNEPSRCNIYYNGMLIFSTTNNKTQWNVNDYFVNRQLREVDVVIETDADSITDEIMIEVMTTDKDFLLLYDVYGRDVANLSVNPIVFHDDSGEVIPSVFNDNKVDIARAVPDMTFGDFVILLKNWFNLDFTPKEDEIHVDFVESKINLKDSFDLRNFEVPRPIRMPQKGMSFLLQFQEVDTGNTDYKFLPVYHAQDGVRDAGYVTNEKTNEISINALPLPLASRLGILTAHSFVKDEAKPFFVLYDGLKNNLNLSQNNTELLMQNIHAQFYRKWFDFRIKSVPFKWAFKAFYEQISGIQKKVFAYGNHHIVKTITKTEVAEDEFEVEIETESLK